MNDAGHNSGTMNADATRLRSFIERAEKLEEEVRAINGDKSDVFKEAKGEGYDVRVMKKIIAMRRMDRDKRREEEEILDLYLTALGMVE